MSPSKPYPLNAEGMSPAERERMVQLGRAHRNALAKRLEEWQRKTQRRLIGGLLLIGALMLATGVLSGWFLWGRP